MTPKPCQRIPSEEAEKPGEAPKTEDASNRHREASRKAGTGRRKTARPTSRCKFRLDKLERSHPYLAERGLTLETIVDFGIGFCAKGMMAERIAIPIQNPEGKVVAYAGRFPGEPAEGTPEIQAAPGFPQITGVVQH